MAQGGDGRPAPAMTMQPDAHWQARLQYVPPLLTLAAMIATPLCRPTGRARRHLATVVVTSLAATTAGRAARRWTLRQVIETVLAVGTGTAAAEWIGSTTGFPFGRYRYTGALQPTVGPVPLLVPAAWFAMAVPARETAHAALGTASTPARRLGLGAVALTAWDLFLDPQMVGEGYWQWRRPGRYRGIPLSNYLGWLLVSAAVMGCLERLLPPDSDADGSLVGEYTAIGVLETVGFARYFADPLVAVVGGSAMVPLSIVALVNRRKRR